MKLGFGSFLSGPFNATTLENVLQKITAAIATTWNVEHKDDGTHTDVTADTVQVGSDPSDGAWQGNVTGSLVPTTSTQDLGATITQGASRVGDHPWRNLRLSGRIDWVTYQTTGVAQSGTPSLVRTSLNLAYASEGTFTWDLTNGVNTHTVTFGRGLNGITTTRAITCVGLSSSASVSATLGFFERGRSTALGEWILVTYAAGNFTASVGAWTVDSGDQAVYKYTLIGKTMILQWSIDSTDVSAGSVLRLAIPGGFTAVHTHNGLHEARDNGGTAVIATCRTVAGLAYIELYPTAGTAGTWAITAADNTNTIGSICFEVT